jgi:hypothetical protein
MHGAYYRLAHDAFPRMPQEIFDLWFYERVARNGWPPVGETWRRVLGCIPLYGWQQITWRESTVDLDRVAFTQNTQSILSGLEAASFDFKFNEYTEMLADSWSKIPEITKYIAAHQKLPSKLIAVVTTNGVELIDGFHRVAIFRWIKRMGVGPQVSSAADAWIGELTNS